MENKYLLISLFIIGLLLGLLIGFALGTYTALDYAVAQAVKMLELKGYTFNFDTDRIASLLMRYNWEEQTNYALIYNDSRS